VGRYEEGLDVDRELAKRRPEDPGVWYNLGCSYALTGRIDEAFSALRRAIELGYDELAWMQKDEDLASLRDDSRFKALLNKAASD
jgi:tetratricopeptide (TPR) repeat protein